MVPRVAVLAEGTMGTALAQLAASGGRPVTLWCRDAEVARSIAERRTNPRVAHAFGPAVGRPHAILPGGLLAEGLKATTDLGEAVAGAELVLVCAPSGIFDDVATALGDVVPPGALVLSATKGLHPRTRIRLSEVLRERTHGRNRVGALGGPNLTTDIMAGDLTALLVAAHSADDVAKAQASLATSRVRVYGTDDLVGAELVSCFKNVVAIGVAIAMGIGLAPNTLSWVLTMALAELRDVVVALGGRGETVNGLAGVADVFLTVLHPGSLNRRLGAELAAGRVLADILKELPELPEGVNAALAYRELTAGMPRRPPLTTWVCDAIHGDADPREIEQRLVSS
jgi:glycerol-3-phosphate dehydrogenase (NAD(P)+)